VSYTSTKASIQTITATYGGDLKHATSNGSTTVTVTPGPPATVTLVPPGGEQQVNKQYCVTATVTDRFGNPTPGITVFFSVTGFNPTSKSVSKTTNTNGQAVFCYIGRLFGVDTIKAFADTNNNGNQDLGEPFGEATVIWTLPVSTPLCSVDFATYGGWIIAANGDRGNFGGNATVSLIGQPVGQEEYQDNGPAVSVNVHSINVQAVVCTVIGGVGRAQIFGEATVNGSATYHYLIDAEDHGEPGTSDIYGILFSNGTFSYDSGLQTLKGGNVQIH
jgi:hypothetical protein